MMGQALDRWEYMVWDTDDDGTLDGLGSEGWEAYAIDSYELNDYFVRVYFLKRRLMTALDALTPPAPTTAQEPETETGR